MPLDSVPPPDKAQVAKRRVTVEKIAAAILEAGIDPEELGSVEKVRYYEGFHKDDDGNTHKVPMLSLAINPVWATGPEWPVVQPAPPVKAVKPPGRPADRPTGEELWASVPDMQIGYRRDLDTMELVPFHDERAIDVMLQVLRWVRPDGIVDQGDGNDFPEWGRYLQEPMFVRVTQPSIDRRHAILAQLASLAERVVIEEGNHDKRLALWVAQNAAHAFGLRRANEPPDTWPVMSLPNLLRLDELGIEYLDGYPNNDFRLTPRMHFGHGEAVNSRGSTAALEAQRRLTCRAQGHVHRSEYHPHVWDDPEFGRMELWQASAGTLARVDGNVPSANASNTQRGKPSPVFENWTQGVGLVTVQTEPPYRADWELVRIVDGEAICRGRHFHASDEAWAMWERQPAELVGA